MVGFWGLTSRGTPKCMRNSVRPRPGGSRVTERPLIQRQVIRHKLVDMAQDIGEEDTAGQHGGFVSQEFVTGGKLEGDRFTEAESSRDYLVANGVPESAILLENDGNSTEESLDGVAVIMNEQKLQSALFVSDGFHLFRTKYIADAHGIDGYGLPADGSPITLTFTVGADGRATAAVMRQNGRERTLPKVR